jgi:tRNA A37 threonylcarbamoyladenosine dehydratase
LDAGGKMDPSKVAVADISKSYNCKLARILRKRLSKLGVTDGFKVVFSSEKIKPVSMREEEGQNKKSTVGTISYMPSIFGCFAASVVIQDLLNK